MSVFCVWIVWLSFSDYLYTVNDVVISTCLFIYSVDISNNMTKILIIFVDCVFF